MSSLGSRSRSLRERRSSPQPAQATDDGRSPRLSAALHAAEIQWPGSEGESAYIFTPEGTQVLHRQGQATSVEFTHQELRHFARNVVTHYHPEERSFSAEDVHRAVDERVAEMRAVTLRYTYSLRPPESGWKGNWADNFASKYRSTLQDASNDLSRQVDEHKLSSQDANDAVLHHVWMRMAAESGWRYERTLWRDRMAAAQAAGYA